MFTSTKFEVAEILLEKNASEEDFLRIRYAVHRVNIDHGLVACSQNCTQYPPMMETAKTFHSFFRELYFPRSRL